MTKKTNTSAPPAATASPGSPEETAELSLPRSRKVSPECPKSANHTHVRVYNTKGRKRYCVCDDCGETFTITGDFALELAEYCDTLVQSLEAAKTISAPDGGAEPVYMFDESTVKEIIANLRTHLSK